MRKPRRLTNEQLAPCQWEMPRLRRGSGQRPESTAPSVEPAVLPRPVPDPFDWTGTLFGNANPVEIEVGMGKGLFLLNSATGAAGHELLRHRDRPQVPALRHHAVRDPQAAEREDRVRRRPVGLPATSCRPASVAAVHVYFPDPWWKARHKKRRVFTPEFAADAARMLCDRRAACSSPPTWRNTSA